jgi:hypothetical protein
MGPEKLAGVTPESAAKMMFDLNAGRLKALRGYFEQEFLVWWRHWKYGQKALRLAEKTGAEIIELVDSDRYTESERRANSAKLFGELDDQNQIGNLLRYILSCHDGLISDIHGRLHHLSLKLGGKEITKAYLHPHPEATIALWGLVMIDTFANAEVAREMPWKCIRKSAATGYKKLDLGIKARAHDKRILDELPSKSGCHELTVPQALIAYKRMAKRMRKLAAKHDEPDFLLLYEYRREVKVLPEWTGRNRMKLLLEHDARFASWGLTPSMIRPSALMNAERADEVHLPRAQVYADHSKRDTTKKSYTGQTPSRILAYREVRKYQEIYQAVTILWDKSSADALGLSQEQVKHLRSEAARTGMGVACLDSKAGVQPGTKRGEDCDQMGNCCDCSQRYVVATEDNFADLVLLNNYTTEKVQKSDAMGAVADEKVIRWKCFTDAVIDKASQSSAAAILQRGRALAQSRRAEYFKAIFSEK